MSFAHPWLLAVVLVPLGWAAASWPRTTRHFNLVLKSLAFAAILLALSQPSITLPERRTAVIMLADTSGSITSDDLSRAESFVARAERYKSRNWLRVVPFAGHTRALTPAEAAGPHFVRTADQGSTNLEAALLDSMAAVPAGHIPRLVLLSDGQENAGSAARAIAELQELNVPVDTVPLAGRSASSLRLESVSMPHQAYAGEQIPIDLNITSPITERASVEISADGNKLGGSEVDLKPGSNVIRVHARVKSTGVTALAGRVRTAGSGELQFEQAVDLRRATVLYFSQDPSGADNNLLQAFDQAGFEVDRDARDFDNDLSKFQLIVLNNPDLAVFTPPEKARLAEYVQNGGGLLLIGGEHQAYKDDKQMDALDLALPAKIAPPRTLQGICVALIIDKSSSMEGRKIELARLSAIGVVDHLRPNDTIGVLIFDNSFQWAVPMRFALDKALIKRLISGITPDGGTQIAPALAEAYRHVLPSRATYKHIVLLTDGISEEGDSMDLAKEAAQNDVTISTVGLGQDVNRSYLEKIAEAAGGRSYFLNDPQGLEQILLKDVQDYSGATAVERPLRPLVVEDAEVLKDTGIQDAPALKGYVRFLAKPNAETILAVDDQKKDPLYVRWQYGLGRAAIFTSDAKSRWAENWIGWPGFDKFWINISRDLLTHANPSQARAQFDAANGDITVSYRLASGAPEPAAIPPIFILGPNGFRKPISVQKIAPRYYEGRLHVANANGLFRIRPLEDSNAFPEVGLYRDSPEAHDAGTNEALLRQIAYLTGGRFDPAPEAVLIPAGGCSIRPGNCGRRCWLWRLR